MDFVKQLEYHIGGVPVKFPCKPYPTQMAMMAKVQITIFPPIPEFNRLGGQDLSGETCYPSP